MKSFNGRILFLDRKDINTDEIIPARYLTEISKTALTPHLFEDLEIEGFHRETDIAGCSIVLARDNFGCGSSREHAPWALEANGIHAVLAPGFARIFRQNMFNCGLLAVEIPETDCDILFNRFSKEPSDCTISVDEGIISVTSGTLTHTISFDLTDFEKELLHAEGWVNYADSRY